MTMNDQNQEQTHQPPRKKSKFAQVFWLSFLVVSLAYAAYSFYTPSNNVAWSEDFASAQEQAVVAGKPTILFFTGTWCVPCRIMKREVWADAQVEETVNAHFTAVIVDVDDPQAAETIRRYQVGATPVTIVVDQDGNVLERADGRIDKEAFLEMLDKANPAS